MLGKREKKKRETKAKNMLLREPAGGVGVDRGGGEPVSLSSSGMAQPIRNG